MRKVLLATSTNGWLRDRATKTGFVRRSVSRFMPGEQIDDALRAASELKIIQADFAEKFQALANLRQNVAGDLRLVPFEFELAENLACMGNR